MRCASSTLSRSKPSISKRQAEKNVKRSLLLKVAMAATADSHVMITPGLSEFMRKPLATMRVYWRPGTLASSAAWRFTFTFLNSAVSPIIMNKTAPAYPMKVMCFRSWLSWEEAELAMATYKISLMETPKTNDIPAFQPLWRLYRRMAKMVGPTEIDINSPMPSPASKMLNTGLRYCELGG